MSRYHVHLVFKHVEFGPAIKNLLLVPKVVALSFVSLYIFIESKT